MLEQLIKSPLFRGCNPASIENLFSGIHHQVKKVKKSEIIAFRGEPCDRLMIPLNGSVRGEMEDFAGKILKIEDIQALKPLSIAFLFDNEGKFPVNVIANEDVSVLIIPKASVLELMRKEPIFLSNFLHLISNRANFLSHRIWFLSFKTIREKIAHYILEKLKPDTYILETKQTQQEIADYFAVSRPSLARVLAEMEEEGMIRMERKSIVVLDKQKLKELLG